MAKQTSLSDAFFVGTADLSGDTGALSAITATRAVIDVSAINVVGHERLLGRSDGTIAWNSFWNPSVGHSHPVLDAVATAAGTTQTIVTYAHAALVGNDAASLVAVQVDYPLTIGADYAMSMAISARGAAGAPLEWGVMLTTGAQTFATASVGAGTVDSGAATAFGAAGILHVLSIASGTATVAIQDSATGSSGWADVAGLVFTAASAATAQRVATGATAAIRRYLRLNVTGTFSNLVCFANAVVYPTSQT